MSNLISLFLNNLLPVFLVAGAGFLLGRLMEVDVKALSRTVFYLFSPALVFKLVTTSKMDGGEILSMVTIAFCVMASAGLIALAASRIFGFDKKLAVAVILTAMIPNSGNYGLSVNSFAFGEQALAFASIFFVTVAVFANSIGVFIASLGRSSVKQSVLNLLKIPTVYAVAISIVFLQFDLTVPGPIEKSVNLLADAAIPGMLVILGLQLQRAKWTGQGLALGTAVTMKLVVSALIGIGLSVLWGLGGAARQAAIVESAMPTAVMVTVIATEFDVEPTFVTLAVFISTVLSPLTVTPILAFLTG